MSSSAASPEGAFKQIERWDILAATVAYILERSRNGGLPRRLSRQTPHKSRQDRHGRAAMHTITRM
ncbi:hypothetical protein [Jannaschia pohangensis]|uniref:Uncharacterized protein n=1 Tax=Jannaschia pohangensis TaxID=390807 RepID=A0A1I3MWB6_9RHOB|nr:hypothetical protein [Jannaschia pohangensis]SFJ01287.1 hypothetical protein SAMN04488095_1978 [Jannaschia pohangensis]